MIVLEMKVIMFVIELKWLFSIVFWVMVIFISLVILNGVIYIKYVMITIRRLRMVLEFVLYDFVLIGDFGYDILVLICLMIR